MMPYLYGVLIGLACVFGPSALILLWIIADERLDGRWDVEHTSLPDADPDWLDSLVDDLPLSEWVDETPAFDRLCFERWEAEL